VSVVAVNDAWVVGSLLPRPGSKHETDRTLAEFYDGTTWSAVETPNVGDYGSDLVGLYERAPGDVWAVGSSRNRSGASRALIEHYDGTANAWSVARTPRSRKFSRALTTVFARSFDDAWAVGFERNIKNPGTGDRPLALHWNGSTWSRVSVPSPGPDARFTGVSQVFGSTGVIAVGNIGGGNSHSFSESYDGSVWTLHPTAPVPGPSDRLNALSGNVAVGSYVDGSLHSHPLAEAGLTTWSQQATEDPPSGDGWFNDVASQAFVSQPLFAVGGRSVPGSTTFVPGRQTLIEHYVCSSSSPSPSTTASPSPTTSVTPTPSESPSPSP
jgi:hypothetical protein